MSINRRSYKTKEGKISVYYLARIRFAGGKRVSKQFERKIDAQAWEAEQFPMLRQNQGGFSNQTKTIKELSDYWLENYAKKRKEGSSRIRDEIALKYQILPYFSNKRLLDLQPAEVEIWQQKLLTDQDLAPKTCNNCLGLLKKMLQDAVRWRFVRFNPIIAVAPFPLGEQDFNFWTLDECKKFLEYVREHHVLVYYAVGIALNTGMRRGEIHALQWDCVDFANKQITIRRTFCLKEGLLKEKTKTKKIRRVPINGSLNEILLELRARGVSKFVLPNFDYEHAGRTVRRIAEQAEVKPIRFHDLRHTFASNFLMSGGSIYKLQKMLGHSTLQMTERYSHLSPEHLNGATELLNFGVRKPNEESGTVVEFRKASDDEKESGHKMTTKKFLDENFVKEFKNLENRGGGN